MGAGGGGEAGGDEGGEAGGDEGGEAGESSLGERVPQDVSPAHGKDLVLVHTSAVKMASPNVNPLRSLRSPDMQAVIVA